MMIHNLLHAICLMADAARSFNEHCVAGMLADHVRIKMHLDNSLMLVTALNPRLGYDKGRFVGVSAMARGGSLACGL